MKRMLTGVLTLLIALLACGCTKKNTIEKPTKEMITLTIGGPWNDCEPLENAIANFSKENPNCNIVYEYIQNYDSNLAKRLSFNDNIDLFLTSNIQKGSKLLPYAQELSSVSEQLDLSNTFPGLIDNFKLQSAEACDQGKIYAVPFGAEVRGMFVNVSLLNSLGISIPTNRQEFLDACETLLQAGYIPIQGNPGMFGQQFLYPYICNLIANAEDYESTYQMVNEKADDTYKLFLDPMEFLYTLVEKGYYNYKYVEKDLKLFCDSSNEGYAKSFLNIVVDEDGKETVLDGPGQVAFMPSTQMLTSVIEKTKEDYHSNIEFQFILSLVGEKASFAYMSPARGIAVNKNSEHIEWALKFMNYLFQEEPNIELCSGMGFIPNTKDAFYQVTKQFHIPESNISHLGQVTFDYDFYDVIVSTLVDISKGNNPKYMTTDAAGNNVMYPFEYYIDAFKDNLKKQE